MADGSELISSVYRCPPNCWVKEALQEEQAVFHHDIDENDPPTEKQLHDIASEIYQPLHSWQTRIINLLPGPRNAALRCELLTVDIIAMSGVVACKWLKIIHYDALSYSWGQAVPTASLLCDKTRLPITRHLADALVYMRDTNDRKFMWVDAVCINQYDNAEKSQQVQNMLFIFEKANRVVGWLGISQKSERGFFRTAVAMSKQPSHPEDGSECAQIVAEHASEFSQIYKEHRRTLKRLLSRPWFARTWIRQEVFAAELLVLQCGEWSLTLEDFVSYIFVLEDPNQHSNPAALMRGLERASFHLSTLCLDYRHSQALRFSDAASYDVSAHWLRTLITGTAFGATNPRDRIYGALGMIQSIAKHRINDSRKTYNRIFPVDYSKSEPEVYQDFILHLITCEQNLRVLCVFENREARASDLPTWTADWRQNIPRKSLAEQRQAPSVQSFEMQEISNNGTLILQGVLLGILPHYQSAIHMASCEIKGPIIGDIGSNMRDFLDTYDYTFIELNASDMCGWDADFTSEERVFQSPKLPFEPAVEQLREQLRGSPVGRCFAAVSSVALPGDSIVRLGGEATPFLLRPCEQFPGRHMFLGPILVLQLRRKPVRDMFDRVYDFEQFVLVGKLSLQTQSYMLV